MRAALLVPQTAGVTRRLKSRSLARATPSRVFSRLRFADRVARRATSKGLQNATCHDALRATSPRIGRRALPVRGIALWRQPESIIVPTGLSFGLGVQPSSVATTDKRAADLLQRACATGATRSLSQGRARGASGCRLVVQALWAHYYWRSRWCRATARGPTSDGCRPSSARETTVRCVVPLLVLLEMVPARIQGARGVPNRSAIELLTACRRGCAGVGNASPRAVCSRTSPLVARTRRGSRRGEAPTTAAPSIPCTSTDGWRGIRGARRAAQYYAPVLRRPGLPARPRRADIDVHGAHVDGRRGVLMPMGVLDEAWPEQPLMSMLRHTAFGRHLERRTLA